MTTKLLHPPKGVTSFTFTYGCGQPHKYDGKHGIDCPACVAHVEQMPDQERLQDVRLRGDTAPWHDDPEQLEKLRREHKRRVHDASYRVEEVEEPDLAEALAPSRPRPPARKATARR